MKLKNLLLIGCILTACLSAMAAGPNKFEAGSQFLAYPVISTKAPRLTPTPKGYEPFHIEHYGRHGSRWLTQAKMYSSPVEELQKAHSAGVLTPDGERLLESLSKIQMQSQGREGELTPLGHAQHREIAQRMTKNFPQIFNGGGYVNANSTIVIRCILSMANEIAELHRINPKLKVKCDASMTTQPTLNFTHVDSVSENLTLKTVKRIKRDFDSNPHDLSAFTTKVFRDTAWSRDNLDVRQLFKKIFDITVNAQSHQNEYDLYEYFTPSELTAEWKERNVESYITCGSTPVTNGRIPFAQRHLLKSIIEATDTALMSPHFGANLRFGHETVVLPLAVLMEVGTTAYETADLNSLSDKWKNYEYFPMAANLQLVFYRPKNKSKRTPDSILVKVLLNETETTLPVKTTYYPYYKWEDVKKYYTDKLGSFQTRFAE